MTDATAPLLVLAAGQRCGSTLVQRLLCSHPRVRIWGEHVGQLRPILLAVERLRVWSDTDGSTGLHELQTRGYQGFLANLTPERADIDAACRAFIETLFANPAREAGRPIWGFKEVRYGLPEALLLRELFREIRVLLLVRDPRDVLRSLEEWETHPGWTRRNTEAALKNWLAVVESFIGYRADPDLREFILTVRYEDLVTDRRRWREAIAEHCALDPALLDEAVFSTHIHAAAPFGQLERKLNDWSTLPSSLRSLLDDQGIQMAASAYGYDLS
jgi:hypothetical protein